GCRSRSWTQGRATRSRRSTAGTQSPTISRAALFAATRSATTFHPAARRTRPPRPTRSAAGASRTRGARTAARTPTTLHCPRRRMRAEWQMGFTRIARFGWATPGEIEMDRNLIPFDVFDDSGNVVARNVTSAEAATYLGVTADAVEYAVAQRGYLDGNGHRV